MKGLIFTYAMTYGGALLSLFKPYHGFLIYVLFANIKPAALWSYSVDASQYSRIIALGFLFGWFLHGMGRWNSKGANGIVLSLLFFWAWLLFSAFTTPAQDAGWELFFLLSKVYLPLLAGLTLIETVEQLKQLAWTIVISQGYLAYEFNQQYYTYGIDPMTWNFAGLDNNCIAITMVVACSLSAFIGMTTESWWQKGLSLGCFILMAHVVLFSMSRGGMLALGIAGVISFVLIPKKPMHYFMLGLAMLAVLRLAGENVRKEFMSIFADSENRDASAIGRLQLLKDGLDCFMRHPLFGCGLENWGNVAVEYGWPRGKRVHNLWVETGANLGIPGLVSLLMFYGLSCWKLLGLTRETTQVIDPWLRGFSRAVIASICAFFISAAFVSVDAIELPYYVVLLGAGALKVHTSSVFADPEKTLPVAKPIPAYPYGSTVTAG